VATVAVPHRAHATVEQEQQRQPAFVRVTHWITALCFFALLISGIEIVISHPRFYWGEVGNVHTPALFQLPIPASRGGVPTGYNYVLPDQNGWSRALHFQSAWLVIGVGILYLAAGLLFTRHFRNNLIPSGADLSWPSISSTIANHIRFKPGPGRDYNVLQRLTYLAVIFVLFPLAIWTGLAMSPAIAAAFPAVVTTFGGQQSARTIHFFVSLFLTAFLFAHILMICLAGFKSRMRAMTIGDGDSTTKE
jgi:thiosulfate reductase cytochrome b subunit